MLPTIPGFELGTRIHSSGTTAVYRARREEDGKLVVIKTLTSEYPSIQSVAELRREFQIAEKLRGIEGVIQVHSLESYSYGSPAIVMDPFGTSLAEYLDQRLRNPVPIGTFLVAAQNIVAAIGEIHRRGVVHKDIAPRNILFDPDSAQVRLIDFGISSELSRERQNVHISKRLEGSLPYISPEQTGRMNRDLDYRSDYYSLGVTFFELLTGRLPFAAEDVLEWIHCHVSKRPPCPTDVNPEIPQVVSDIVLKLLAKNAEERYQSAYGLKADLETCLANIRQAGAVDRFELGKLDVSATFQLSQKLYGRTSEIRHLMETFDQVAQGDVSLCIVSGFSGVGKTSLVNEIHKPIVRERGHLIQGKFDQFQRNVPYSAVADAFRSLARQLMAEPPEKLDRWRGALNESLGANAQLIVEIVPEIENIIGRQPPAPRLSATETQNRFQLIFCSFVQTFATAEHPLVLFLDDLQWADPPSLNLLHRLVTSREISNLLVIGAYRSNEVGTGHPLALTLDEILRSKKIVELPLPPLDQDSVTQLVADTLHSQPADCAKLAELLFLKSEGNPYFINELLKTLHEEQAISFSTETGRWQWDLELVERSGLGAGVVEFIIAKLRRLDEEAQHALQLASCIGDTFDLRVLSMISEEPLLETGRKLDPALRGNIVVPLDSSYRYIGEPLEDEPTFNPRFKFQHDRVQQAAYALIDPAEKKAVHLSIGRLLLKNSDPGSLDQAIIDTVSHLNRGRSLIDSPAEQRDLARLNLRAGEKAKHSSAYESALDFLCTGLDILPGSAWDDDYELAKALSIEYVQCAYQTGNYGDAEHHIDAMLGKMKTPLEKADLLSIRTRQYATTGRMDDSIQAAIQGLATLGLRFARNPSKPAIWREILLARWNLRGRTIAEVAGAPPLTDPEKLIAIRLLMEIFPAAFLSGSGNLLPYLVLKGVNLSLRYGNCPETAFAYAAYGMVLCGLFNNPRLGYEYGKLAVSIDDQFGEIALRSRILYVYTMFVHHWSNHWSSMTPWFKKAIAAGYQSGDLLYLAYSAQDCIIWDPTNDLETSCAEQRKYLSIVKDCEYRDSYDSGTLFLRLLLNLRGLTDGLLSMSDETFDERQCLEGMRARKFMTGIANYHIYKLEICFAYRHYDEALVHIAEQDKLLKSSMSLPQLVRFYLISFLTFSQYFEHLPEADRPTTIRRLKRDLKQVRRWADNCPENFLHIQRLMEGELARLCGKPVEATCAYGDAIKTARQNRFLRDEALASELFANYYIANGQDRAAEGYLRAAHLIYTRIGATRKSAHLEESHPDLLTPPAGAKKAGHLHETAGNHTSQSSSLNSDLLDITSVLKASQAISGEIVIGQLLQTVMDIMLENAGGQTGFFIIMRGGAPSLVAHSIADPTTARSETFTNLPVTLAENDAALPHSIINYVLVSKQPLVLDDAREASEFAHDPYLVLNQPKSVLCFPISRGREFEGAVYLENNLTVGAFTEERLQVMKMLASQATISIENAQLYDSLETKVRERTKKLVDALDDLKQTQSQLVQSEKMAGLGTLVSGVAHEINNPTNFVHLGAGSLKEDLDDFRTILFEMIEDDGQSEIVNDFKDRFRRFSLALESINEGTNRIQTIVRDLRTFSRLDEAEMKCVSLVENIESTVRLVKAQYRDNIEFSCDFDADPQIDCFPAQLNQVFLNLMVNACQAICAKQKRGDRQESGSSPPDQMLGTIHISTRAEDGVVRVIVKDDGVGMSPETQQKVFEPFFTTKEVGEGTGLGMSISYKIVAGHRGRFEIASEVGKGTSVSLILPLASAGNGA